MFSSVCPAEVSSKSCSAFLGDAPRATKTQTEYEGMDDAEDCPFCRFVVRSPGDRLNFIDPDKGVFPRSGQDISHWAHGRGSSSHLASAHCRPARAPPNPARNGWPISKSSGACAEATSPSLHLSLESALSPLLSPSARLSRVVVQECPKEEIPFETPQTTARWVFD